MKNAAYYAAPVSIVALRMAIWLIVCSCVLYSQTTKQKAPVTPDCNSDLKAEFGKGFDAASQLFTTTISTADRIPIAIVVEDIGSKVELHLTAAEVLNELYPGRFTIDDSAELVLWVSGTAVDSVGHFQSYLVEIYRDTMLPFTMNGTTKYIRGRYVFASHTGVIQGTDTFRIRGFKETIFETTGDFLKTIK